MLILANSQISWAGIGFFDGSRIVKFTDSRGIAPPSRFGDVRLTIQSWFHQPIDWDPLPDIAPTCPQQDFIASWQVNYPSLIPCDVRIAKGTHLQRSGRTLSMVLTQDQLERYRDTCLPRLWNMLTPAFPSSNDSNHGNSSENPGTARAPQQMPTREDNESRERDFGLPFANTDANLRPGNSNTRGMFARLFRSTQRRPPRPDSRDAGVVSWDIYCCINKMYTEPLETILRYIDHKGLDDEKFLIALNKEIKRAAGNWFWGTLRRNFSWKRCSRITFVEVVLPAPETLSRLPKICFETYKGIE